VTAEELSRVERDETWPMITARAPGYADYQRKTSRVIAVFALRRA
jgi:hypothetical protein